MLLLTENEIRKIIRTILEKKKRRKKKKKKKANSRAAKELMLDKPFTTGGWPAGEDRGWLPGSKPVNVQIRSYLEDMGMLEE